MILWAEGEAKAIKLINKAANAKVVVPSDCELVNVIGEMAGVLPLPVKLGEGQRLSA